MHIMVPTLLKIVRIQSVLNVNLDLIITLHLNGLEDTHPTHPLTTVHLTTTQLEMHMKLIAMQSLNCNYQQTGQNG